MKNLTSVDYVSLTPLETQQIIGGTFVNLWEDFSSLISSTVKGVAVFSTQGGRNAGICVK